MPDKPNLTPNPLGRALTPQAERWLAKIDVAYANSGAADNLLRALAIQITLAYDAALREREAVVFEASCYLEVMNKKKRNEGAVMVSAGFIRRVAALAAEGKEK